jgi:hypothetical protein
VSVARVSDHALLRYLQRVRGFKFDKEIAEIRKIVGTLRDGTVKAHGCLFKVKDGTVISILPDEKEPNRTTHEAVRNMTFR